ncbi:MAG: lysophospholipid acyltransferase family protein [Desulfobacterales bacterium]|nr:lysophospholipid acyltransferase family protein [Desulfobacterales bacterium]
MKRETLQKLVDVIFHVIADIRFVGAENIPAQGGIILATNHMSRLDIPLLFLNPTRPDITALVADKYKSQAFFRWFTQTSGGIWIDRSKADFNAFRQAADVLKAGTALGIAPEGTRSEIGALLEAKAGTALLAVRTRIAVVPVAIEGSEVAISKLKHLRRPRLVTHFGKPIPPPELTRDDRDAVMQRYTDEIMCQIAAMLPPKYHGFYAAHPRLKEILSTV